MSETPQRPRPDQSGPHAVGEPGFEGTVARTVAESTPWWPEAKRPRRGVPNVVIVVLDDVGFADFGSYGSELSTPTIDSLAAGGLRYSQFHTTTLCSPTRAALLTGRNHHSVGMSIVAEWDAGFSNTRSRVTPAAATLPQILRDAGYSTSAVGKWHLAPPHEQTQVGPFDNWPLAKGFERFYGFLGGATDQFFPELARDNTLVDPPARPEDGYHLTVDLVDESITVLADHLALAPDKPFFHYLAFGAAHWPLQAPRAHIDRQRGRFDRGWDVHRTERFARQKQLGIVPDHAELPPLNLGVPAWDDLSDDERTFAVRLQEAYAAVIEHTDEQLGRFVDFLRDADALDDTIIVLLSDNGASQEGGPTGYLHFSRLFNLQPTDIDQGLQQLDAIGGPTVHPAYPWGWAQVSNTPLKRYKGNTHGGGVRDPLIIHWPNGIEDGGGIRSQFHHAIDITPTILELAGLSAPSTFQGIEQLPIHGTSLAYTFDRADAPSTRTEQHFEMGGHRAIYRDGWKAVTFHAPGTPYEDDVWELYHLAEDFSETHDLAAERPDLVGGLAERWWELAEQYGVLPIDDRLFERFGLPGPPGNPRLLTDLTFHPGTTRVPGVNVPNIANRSYRISVPIDRDAPSDRGVLVRQGTVSGGYVLYVEANRAVLEHNRFGDRIRLTHDDDLPVGKTTIDLTFTKTAALAGRFSLRVDGVEVARTDPVKTLAITLGAGFEIGGDIGSPVSQAYEAPFRFTGDIGPVEVHLGDDAEPVTLPDLID